MKVCSIVAAGPSPLYLARDSFIIAVDGGQEKLAVAGIRPDCILGDFDSSPLPKNKEKVLTFPKEKDETDTVLAIDLAARLGCDTLYISGGVGGRLDHTVANLQSLAYASKRQLSAFLCDGGSVTTLLTAGTARLTKGGGLCSLFAFGGDACVSLDGLKYEGEKLSLTCDFPLGVSNERKADAEACITVHQGQVLLYWEGTPEELCFTKGAK